MKGIVKFVLVLFFPMVFGTVCLSVVHATDVCAPVKGTITVIHDGDMNAKATIIWSSSAQKKNEQLCHRELLEYNQSESYQYTEKELEGDLCIGAIVEYTGENVKPHLKDQVQFCIKLVSTKENTTIRLSELIRLGNMGLLPKADAFEAISSH